MLTCPEISKYPYVTNPQVLRLMGSDSPPSCAPSLSAVHPLEVWVPAWCTLWAHSPGWSVAAHPCSIRPWQRMCCLGQLVAASDQVLTTSVSTSRSPLSYKCSCFCNSFQADNFFVSELSVISQMLFIAADDSFCSNMNNLGQMSSQIVLCSLIHSCCLHSHSYLYKCCYPDHLSKVGHGSTFTLCSWKEIFTESVLVSFQLWAGGSIGVENCWKFRS